ncbi:helix-turn-helix domain-containing protein [Herbaspirillum frisingense]|uniref:helix-turn-helix domain-containing protein n=1 Tax=Herbaspirillum frisingense TaxID=92645 RepID=UPI001F266D1A|nr:helix-turn-helix transcriptional regulator [Herbaspirillum frisingense]UIN20838.1 helix-turn-helix domain-containing protein [Herbaspirillum frisingense]
MTAFHERLKFERKRLGLSQEKFALLGGVTRDAQMNYENGSRKPDSGYLQRIFEAGVDVAFLFSGSPSTEALEQDERELLNGYRTIDVRTKARVLGIIEGAGSVETERKNSSHITVGGSIGHHIIGDIHGTLQGPVMVSKIVKKK